MALPDFDIARITTERHAARSVRKRRVSWLGSLIVGWTILALMLSWTVARPQQHATTSVPTPRSIDSADSFNENVFANNFDVAWSGVSNVLLALPGSNLTGRLYLPSTWTSATPAVVLMHGCKGLWSLGQPWPDRPDAIAQSAIERWGLELSRNGYIALAIDSFTSRTPLGIASADYQNQCQGELFEGSVDPYVTRVGDIDFGIAWLRSRLNIAATTPIAAIGWSEGAESVLVRAAETDRLEDTSLYQTPADEAEALRAAVAFYPGCGSNLGFNRTTESFWRPHRDLKLNHAELDPLNVHCASRADTALTVYGSEPDSGHWIDWTLYADAHHSFDTSPTLEWPDRPCSLGDALDADVCAQRSADIDSLAFLTQRLH